MWILSRESKINFGGPTASYGTEGNTEQIVIARAVPPPRGPRPCARTPRDIHGSREVPHLVLSGIGVRAVNPQGARQRRTDAGSLTAP